MEPPLSLMPFRYRANNSLSFEYLQTKKHYSEECHVVLLDYATTIVRDFTSACLAEALYIINLRPNVKYLTIYTNSRVFDNFTIIVQSC